MRNDLEGLKRTRKSLEQQEYKNWLHVIIDGDSIDGTKMYLKLLPSENTLYISEPDSGIYNAMNKGWKLAIPNSFVYYLNARDVLATNVALNMAAAALQDSTEGMWGCTTHEEINEDGTGWVCKLVSPPTVSNQLYAFGYRSHQGVLMKTELIEELGGFDESYKIASDWDLIVRAMRHSRPVVWVHPLGKFELGGFSTHNLLTAHYELIEIRKKYLTFTVSTKLFELLWRDIYLSQFGYRSRILFLREFLKWAKVKSFYLKDKMNIFAYFSSGNISFFGIKITIHFTRTRLRKRSPSRVNRLKKKLRKGRLIQITHSQLKILPYQRPKSSSEH